ncbi:hypothetical protein A3742_17350 [Oleiphilus sp. HI0071]|uniref:hypothetical protein n=1 Tax=unclassified Oleiphilus TaxID=2631174 RepID=UPI0007C39415|nr:MULTISPECIES: hypothetical protein [unclassified Oleiphilus]KZY70048.1 hypothetical protein A3737_30620 [Oleiphilus sp. HI0065]KZY82876.1 hypothetical protein A3742_08340 [Oleiphilus sp. HI0071]KZY95375.1 hypothetical protein A3744_34725 [Oleiphilus sp. HI0073]KZZ49182.1 hypothetical protein A3760_03045 [Oleiphilus sp. HI0122]KZZ80248.1 hypothetical protein A3767_00755 [Oleiphilus sp. HI0133]
MAFPNAPACFGCFWIVWLQLELVSSATFRWYLVGLDVPVSIAVGNVYRTLAWPEGVPPVALAAGLMIGMLYFESTMHLVSG